MSEPRGRPVKTMFEGQMMDAIELEFTAIREDWNVYQVADGSKIKMRVILATVHRIHGKFDRLGNPVYSVGSSNIASVESPENLKGQPSS